jgi:ribosomal protein S18 acetylase RimI-like enzyme
VTRLSSALRHRGAVFENAAEHVRRLDLGSVVSHGEVPLSRDLNQLRVEEPQPELEGALLAALGGKLGVRQIEVWDPATGERLCPAMEAEGWQADRLILLVAPEAIPGARHAEEVPLAALHGLREEWLRATPEIVAKDIVGMLQRTDALLNTSTPTRGFLACSGDGEPAAIALLQTAAEGMAMIEDVYTTASQRHNGLGRAVVAAALAAGRADGASFVHLNTDVDGPARRFYSKLGFTELGVLHRFFAPE